VDKQFPDDKTYAPLMGMLIITLLQGSRCLSLRKADKTLFGGTKLAGGRQITELSKTDLKNLLETYGLKQKVAHTRF
jgi:hypothetical protein